MVFLYFQKTLLTYWSSVVPPRQLVMSVPAYGRSYTLRSELFVHPGAPTAGAGDAGNYTQVPGFMAYYEVSLSYTYTDISEASNTRLLSLKEAATVPFEILHTMFLEKVSYVEKKFKTD